MSKEFRTFIYFIIFISFSSFVLYLHTIDYKKHQTNQNTVSVEEFEKMKKQIQSLKRIQDVLIKNENEHWNNHAQEKVNNGEVVFPRIDNYCPSTMIYNEEINQLLFVDNLCNFEKQYWK